MAWPRQNLTNRLNSPQQQKWDFQRSQHTAPHWTLASKHDIMSMKTHTTCASKNEGELYKFNFDRPTDGLIRWCYDWNSPSFCITWIIARQMTVILNTISFDRRFGLSSAEPAAVSGRSSDSWRNMHRLKSCRALWQICCTYLASELHTDTAQDHEKMPSDQNFINTMEHKMKYNNVEHMLYTHLQLCLYSVSNSLCTQQMRNECATAATATTAAATLCHYYMLSL